MNRRILVAYASRHGSTHEVAEAVAGHLRQAGLATDVVPAGQVEDLAGFDAVVLGGALYMGRWHADARRFLKHHADALTRLPVAIFAMGPLTLAEKDVAGSRAQLDRALARWPGLVPVAVEIFGGVVEPADQHFPFNHMPAADARDWDAVRAFARTIANRLGAPTAAG